MTFAAGSKAFFTAFKETLATHFAGVGGIIAGFIVAWQLNVFQYFPWAIAVYPTVLTAKSVISGLFSGRLNTALHIGTVSPSFSGNMVILHRLFQPILAITLATSFVMSVFSMVFGGIFWGITFADFPGILVVVLATMNLGLALYLFTLTLTFSVFRKGLDLDSVAYPIIATVADIFITVCYALMLYLFSSFNDLGRYSVLVVAVLPAIFMLYTLPRNVHEEGFVKTLKASILALMFVAVIANVTGTVLQRISVITSNRKEIFAVYPALLELMGDAGFVVSFTATTRLALGLLKPEFSAMKDHALQIVGAWTASAVALTFCSALALFTVGIFDLPAFSVFASLLLMTNVIAAVGIIIVSYALAVLTFQKGLDSDHFVVPIECSLAGVITSTALLAALFLIKLV